MPFDVEVVVPCYKRPEYTYACIEALESAQVYDDVLFHLYDDFSNDGTDEILRQANMEKNVVVYDMNRGLRNVVIDFIQSISWTSRYIAKVDNDVIMPKEWLNNLIKIMERNGADIISPNVYPSMAAFKLGDESSKNEEFIRSDHVGGLWVMKTEMLKGMSFDKYPKIRGINGAFEILNQIILDKDPVIGWAHNVVAQDIGHWSGNHPLCIKNQDHRDYYAEINRKISW